MTTATYLALAREAEPEEPLWLALSHDEALDLFIKLSLDDDFIDVRRRLELLMQMGPLLRLVEDE